MLNGKTNMKSKEIFCNHICFSEVGGFFNTPAGALKSRALKFFGTDNFQRLKNVQMLFLLGYEVKKSAPTQALSLTEPYLKRTRYDQEVEINWNSILAWGWGRFYNGTALGTSGKEITWSERYWIFLILVKLFFSINLDTIPSLWLDVGLRAPSQQSLTPVWLRVNHLWYNSA